MGEPLTTPSIASGPGLPWHSGRTFRVWRYGIGHSQLLLRAPGGDGQPTLGLLCEGVEFMKLRRDYPQLTLRLAEAAEEAGFPDVGAVPVRLLHLVLQTPGGAGLVACSRVTVRQSFSAGDDTWAAGEVLLAVVP